MQAALETPPTVRRRGSGYRAGPQGAVTGRARRVRRSRSHGPGPCAQRLPSLAAPASKSATAQTRSFLFNKWHHRAAPPLQKRPRTNVDIIGARRNATQADSAAQTVMTRSLPGFSSALQAPEVSVADRSRLFSSRHREPAQHPALLWEETSSPPSSCASARTPSRAISSKF